MAKRLQVILQDPEYRAIQKSSRARRMSLAAWVREALASALRKEPESDARRKLEAIREAAKYEFPTADIETMLAEIESGYESAPEK